jgi:hypothetical protein
MLSPKELESDTPPEVEEKAWKRSCLKQRGQRKRRRVHFKNTGELAHLISESEREVDMDSESSPEVGLDFGPSKEEDDRCITIGKVTPSTGYTVKLRVQDLLVEAVVDTGAGVSVLGTEQYDLLENKPPVKRYVTLMQAGVDARLKGFIAGPFSIQVGENIQEVDLYVAPLKDPMLLGIDFLCKAVLDLERGKLSLGGETIHMTSSRVELWKEARVSLARKVCIPAGFVVLCPARLDRKLGDYMVESSIEQVSDLLLMLHTYHASGSSTQICLVNPSERDFTLQEGSTLGDAVEAGLHVPVPYQDRKVCSRGEEHRGNLGTREVPAHLQDLLERSSRELSREQRGQLADLLTEFQYVFARSEFDFGDFTALEHRIDTGDAAPIKERMRRIPLFFVDEEEAHLKMLDAGVTQPSISEWASAPVLIMKKDGNVRWCLGYRRLNNVTREDVFPLPLIDECMDTLTGNVWFSKLDANSAFHKIKISPEDRKKTAFITRYSLYEFVRMGF